MKKTTRIAAFTAAIALAWTLLSSGQAGAQTTRICDGLTATIVGTAGDDVLEGTEGDAVFFAAQGNDVIFGLGGDDVICAGQGDDVVMGGQGFDIIFGAQGDDVLFAADGSSPADRADTRGARMFGGAGDDLLVGSDRWDRMQGGFGVDHFEGHEGRDWIRGGSDGDFIDGGPGIDDTNGGNGNDRMIATTGDLVRGSNGNDLCALLGEPGLLRSCTENSRAFATARQAPIVPPTESGLEQTLEYFSEIINSRENERWTEIFVGGCFQVLDAADFYAGVDQEIGSDWRIELIPVAGGRYGGLIAQAGLQFTYFAPDGTILIQDEDGFDNYLHDRGMWRVEEQC